MTNDCLCEALIGANIKTAQEMTGQNGYEVTANIYTHGSSAAKETAAVMQNEFISGLLKQAVCQKRERPTSPAFVQ